MLDNEILQVLDKVYEQENLDFKEYKESTLKRRIERRFHATKTESFSQYMDVLNTDPGECKKLIENIAIQVTEFFRNPDAWQTIYETILPQILKEKITDKTLNIWCAGCSTGQEVYSIAILIDQFLDEMKTDLAVNIWGTDIAKDSVTKARQASYKPDQVNESDQYLLNKYFDHSGNLKANCRIRNWVHFKQHDLVLDKPLQQMDLIICRNVAIYFTRSLQEKVFMDFYDALNQNGYLFLGKAETLLGPIKEKFSVIDKKWKMYQKVQG